MKGMRLRIASPVSRVLSKCSGPESNQEELAEMLKKLSIERLTAFAALLLTLSVVWFAKTAGWPEKNEMLTESPARDKEDSRRASLASEAGVLNRIRHVPAPSLGTAPILQQASVPSDRPKPTDVTPEFLERRTELKRSGNLGSNLDSESSLLMWEALNSSSAENRKFALTELSLTRPGPQVQRVLATALRDPDPDIRLEALLSIENLRDSETAQLLLDVATNDISPEVREAALDVYNEIIRPTIR